MIATLEKDKKENNVSQRYSTRIIRRDTRPVMVGDITTVQSYDTYNFGSEIPIFDELRTSDFIDIRPRVSDYSVTESSRSPFEFLGRTFGTTGHSAANVLASDETILTTFSYYQGRWDRIFLTKEGEFQVKFGTPDDNPDLPEIVDDAIEIAQLELPPYIIDRKSVV